MTPEVGWPGAKKERHFAAPPPYKSNRTELFRADYALPPTLNQSVALQTARQVFTEGVKLPK